MCARATILRLLVILIESPLPELNGEYPIKLTLCFSCQGKTSYSTPRSERLYRSSLAKQSLPPGTLNSSSKSATSKLDTPQWRIKPSFCNSFNPRTVSDKRLSPHTSLNNQFLVVLNSFLSSDALILEKHDMDKILRSKKFDCDHSL